VWEWCWDLCDDGNYYNTAPSTNPRGPDVGQYGSYRVIRGGSWLDIARNTRCAFRVYDWPYFANDFYGFRLARGQP
jgi:formylglycine-generating enzyme required for sulfatase activity